MTKEEIRAKSMELALKFMELVYELPYAEKEALEKDETGEIDRVFKRAEWISKIFERFIQDAH
jgi:hypothetical protein